MEETGLSLALCLLGSSIGWIAAMAISGVFHWLRGIAPRPTAFPGMGIACLWLLCDFVFLLLAATYCDAAWFQVALVTALPVLGCAGIAWWHEAAIGVPRRTAFGILMVELAVALFVWSLLPEPCRLLCRTFLGSESGDSPLYACVLPVLLLTLAAEEIAAPLRRRARTGSLP